MKRAPNPRPEGFRFPIRVYEVLDPVGGEPFIFVEVVHLGPGGDGHPPGVKKEWSPREVRDWYRVTIMHPEIDPELGIDPEDFVTNEYGGSHHDFDKGFDLSLELAKEMVLDLGEAAEHPDSYFEEATRKATPEQAELVEKWIAAGRAFGVEIWEAKDVLQKNQNELRLRRKPVNVRFP